jgi:NADH dehydrogenase
VQQREWLTFAVVGGGPTGVELAGALGEIGLHTLANDFRCIDPTQVKVVLFEGNDRVLTAYPPKLSAAAKRELEKRHVDVRLGARVTDIDATGVVVKTGSAGIDTTERVGTRTVLWAAGVKASSLSESLGAKRDRSGRVEVEPDLSIAGHPEVFVIGDLAKMLNADGTEVPGVAQGAMQGGKYVGRVIASAVAGHDDRKPFRYHDKGNMATIGRASAVIATKRVAASGLFVWMFWWVVHIMFLIGFRSRVLVMFHWAWTWLSFTRGARLITGKIVDLPPVRSIGPDGEPAVHQGASTIAISRSIPENPRAQPPV